MKANLSRMLRSGIAMLLAICLVVGIVPSAAFAAPEEIKYVSLGDSMTNGYGLPGYDGNTGVEDYGNGSYANLFADWLVAEGYAASVKHTQLAMSAMRAEDLHWLLELDYNDSEAIALTDGDWDEAAWNAKFTTGDYWTWNELCDDYRFAVAASTIVNGNPNAKIRDNEAVIVGKYYQEAVKEADIISLGIGNGNFGVFAFGRIMEAVGFSGSPEDAMIYNVDRALAEVDPALKAQIMALKAELTKKAHEYLVAYAEELPFDITSAEAVLETPTVKALINTMVYTGLSYVLNYAGTVEAILKLNPDAEIILVALMNTFGGAAKQAGADASIGDLLDYVYTPLNAYIAALPTVMKGLQNAQYADAAFYYAEASSVECLVDVYEEELENPESVIRARFVESIVGTASDPGMVWGLMAGAELVDGVSLEYITLADVKAYEAMNDVQKAGFAATNTGKAVSVAAYLAFEDAVKSASDASVSLASIMGLGTMDASMFGAVIADFMADATVDGKAYLDTAATVVATGSGMLTPEQVKALVAGGDAAIYATVAGFAGLDAATVEYLYVNELNDTVVANVNALKTAVSSTEMLCMLLTMPETLSNSLQEEPTVKGLLGLFARCVIGNGLGAHPSANGHKTLAKAVEDAYANGYTAQDKTLDNLQFALAELLKIIETYGPDALEEAYKYAEENGYIDQLKAAIADANAWLKEHHDNVIVPTLEAQLAELEAQLKNVQAQLKALNEELLKKKAELENAADEAVAKIEAAIAELEALIAYTEAKIAEIEAAIAELKAELVQLQKNIAALAEAVEDMDEAVADLIDALKAASLDAAKEAAAAAREAAVAAYEAIVALNEQVTEGLKQIDGLYEKVTELVTALNDYVTEKLGAMAALIGDVVDENVQAAIDAINAELAKAIAAVEAALAEEIAALKAQYEEQIAIVKAALAEELAKIDAEIAAKIAELNAQAEKQIAAVKAEIEAKIAELEACIAQKQAELAKLYADLENAAEEVKAQIEQQIAAIEAELAELNAQLMAAKAELEAKIAEIQAQIEEQIAAVKAQIEAAHAEAVAALKKAAQDLQAELEAKIAELEAQVQKQIETLKAEAQKQIETLLAAAENAVMDLIEKAEAQIETVVNETLEYIDTEMQALLASVDALISEQVQNLLDLAKAALIRSTTADLEINDEFKYVALGDGTAVAEGYAEALKAILDEQAQANGVKNIDFVNAAKEGNTVAAEAANLSADVADADLITLGFSQTEMLGSALKALLAGNTSFDWAALLGEKAVPYVAEAMEKVNEEIAALELDAATSAQMSAVVEAYAYAAVEYTVTLPALVQAIRTVNTDAVIMVVGMYNPIDGVVIDAKHPIAGDLFYFDLGQFSEYFDYLIHGVRAFGVGFAVLTDEVDYVDAPYVAVKTPTLGLDEFYALSTKGDVSALYPSTAGAQYIAEQIAKALNLTFKSEGLLGDANSDGIVDSYDAFLVAEYDVGNIGASDLNLAVCDVSGDGIVDSYDAFLIAEFDVGNISKFPAA